MDRDTTVTPENTFPDLTAQPGRRAFLKTGLGAGFVFFFNDLGSK